MIEVTSLGKGKYDAVKYSSTFGTPTVEWAIENVNLQRLKQFLKTRSVDDMELELGFEMLKAKQKVFLSESRREITV